jgi:VanZ family protein
VSGSSSGVEAKRFHPFAALLAAAWAGGIWWESSREFSGIPGSAFWGFLGNSFHFVLFGVLAMLIAESLRTPEGLTRARLLTVVLLVLGYGWLDEFHQSYTPGRSADPADVCVDLLGAIACVSLWWGVRGPGRLGKAVARLLAVGGVAAAFNAWRAWGPRNPT